MIVDFHCHPLPPGFAERHHELAGRDRTYAALFPKPGGRIADVEALLREMDAAGVDRAVAMGFGWTDQEVAKEANDYLMGAGRAYPDRITALASVNPAWGEAAVVEAERCLDGGAAGIGELHADTQGFDITDGDALSPLMELLRERGTPVVIHASEPVGHHYPGKGTTTPEQLLKFVANFPDNRMVLAHLGGGLPFYAAMPEVGAALGNVWYDTAALPYLYRAEAVAAAALTAGAERILFGSDWPLLRQRRVMDYVGSATLAVAGMWPFDGRETLPDYLRDGLDIVLIGLNPSAYSVREGHYFANPRNRFWAALSASGLAGREVGPGDDAGMLADGIGFTDVVKRATPQASGLTAADYRRDAPLLREKLLRYAPTIACFHGLTAYRAYLRHAEGVRSDGDIGLGRQSHCIGESRVFVLPNPSPANARYSLEDLAEWYRRLGEWRAELKSGA